MVRVRALASSSRALIAASFAVRRAALVAVFLTVTGAIHAVAARAVGLLTGWLMGRAQVVQAMVMALVLRVVTAAASIGAAVRQGVSAVTAGVRAATTAVVNGVVSFARSIPIPNLPLVGRIRNAALRVVEGVGRLVNGAVDGLLSFAERVVTTIVEGVVGVLGRLGAMLLAVVARVVAALARAVAWVTGRLLGVVARVVALIGAGLVRAFGILRTVQRAALQQVSSFEAAALRRIEANRQDGRAAIDLVLDTAAGGGDPPADPALAGHMVQLEDAGTAPAFDSAARGALALVYLGVRRANAATVRAFRMSTRSALALALGVVIAFIASMRARAHVVLGQVIAVVARAVAHVLAAVAAAVAGAIAAARGVVERCLSVLMGVIGAAVAVVRAPVAALARLGSQIVQRARTFVTRLVDRLVSFFRRGGTQAGSEDSSSITAGVEDYTPSRLAAVARMASPPAAAALVLAPAAAAVSIWVILQWVALILIALLILFVIGYAIYKLIEYLTKPKPVPIVRARPRVRPRVRPRRRPRKRKLLTWRAGLSYSIVTASGGMPGTLDFTVPAPGRMHLEGHHVWPKYVGGPEAQPLLSARVTVHRGVLHPGLHAVMAPVAARMGHVIVPNRTNPAFILYLRANPREKALFAAAILSFYAGLNSQTQPPMPAAAFTPGIAVSAASLI